MSVTHSQTQKVDSLCNSIIYDTVSANLIVEIDANYKYYSIDDAIAQQNRVFLDKGISTNNLLAAYNSDTVIVIFLTEWIRFFKSRDCVNLASISGFLDRFDTRLLSKRAKKRFRKSLFLDKNGVKYLKIRAKLKVINAGVSKQLIPKIYSTINCGNALQKYCEVNYTNTLIIADVINFSYR